MKTVRDKVTFTASALIYLLFTLRLDRFPEPTLVGTLKHTAINFLETAPYVAGATFIVISFIQYMIDGQKLPWDRRLRLFFLLGIMGGLFMGIWDYAGTETIPQ